MVYDLAIGIDVCPFFGLFVRSDRAAGHWDGAISVPDREIKIALDLTKDDKGAWIGTFTQLPNARNVPVSDLKVDGKSVKFRVGPAGSNAPNFDCTQEDAASLNCTLSVPGGSVSAPLKRTGEAKVELPKSSPAVSKELEGDWEGALETPNGSLKLVVHFKNQPDDTVKATIDSPDQNSMDLPLSDVSQKDSAVEFQLRLVGGSFKGTLNKEGTQLAGEWSQSGNNLALTLKKSAAK